MKRGLAWKHLNLEGRQSGFLDVDEYSVRNVTTMMAWAADGNLIASQNGTSFVTLDETDYYIGFRQSAPSDFRCHVFA